MEKETIFTQDKLQLYVVKNKVAHPIAHIIYLHGYTEHCHRHDEVVSMLCANKISVTRYDHRGFGLSEGERAYIDRFDQYAEDLHKVRKKYYQIGIPNFLMGVSMGGLIIVNYLIKYGEGGIAGALLLAPALKLDDSISPFLVKMSGFLGKYLPKLKTVKLESDALSRSPGVKEKYLNDPLVYTKGTKSRTGLEIIKAMRFVQNNYSKISLPVLILQGNADRLADPQGSKDMYKSINSSDKELIIYKDLYHELHFEPEKEKVFEDIIRWLTDETRLLRSDTGKEIA